MADLAVDTNVLAIANGLHDHASDECVLNARRRLLAIVDSDRVVHDTGLAVFREYQRYSSRTGEPGIGDFFFKWVWDNRANPQRTIELSLTPLPGQGEDYAEFPDSLRSAGFDPNDRKFVALALATDDRTVVNGIDRGYVTHLAGLIAEGVTVDFVCPTDCGPDTDS